MTKPNKITQTLKGYSTPNENFIINDFPPCLSKPVKALFIFGTQFKIFYENREACDCPIDCQTINTVKAQKSMKDIVRIVHLPSVVQSELYEATRILFVRKENKIMTIRLLCVSPCQRSAILEIIHWTQTAYALLYQPQHKDAFSTCIYALIWMKIAHPCVVADTEECTQFAFRGYSPKWRYGDTE